MQEHNNFSYIEKYNLITEDNIVTPNYNIYNKEIYFDIYVSHKKEVCIVGALDNNYICWCSITSVDEKEINTQIFNYLLNIKRKLISTESKALKSRFNEVNKWHNLRIYKDEHRYYLPSSGAFCGDDEKYYGGFLATEISIFFHTELSKCKYRLIDNSYLLILGKYKDILTKDADYRYYEKMKPLITILKDESYIKLCPFEETRNLYLECIEECSKLYSRYMTVVR